MRKRKKYDELYFAWYFNSLRFYGWRPFSKNFMYQHYEKSIKEAKDIFWVESFIQGFPNVKSLQILQKNAVEELDKNKLSLEDAINALGLCELANISDYPFQPKHNDSLHRMLKNKVESLQSVRKRIFQITELQKIDIESLLILSVYFKHVSTKANERLIFIEEYIRETIIQQEKNHLAIEEINSMTFSRKPHKDETELWKRSKHYPSHLLSKRSDLDRSVIEANAFIQAHLPYVQIYESLSNIMLTIYRHLMTEENDEWKERIQPICAIIYSIRQMNGFMIGVSSNIFSSSPLDYSRWLSADYQERIKLAKQELQEADKHINKYKTSHAQWLQEIGVSPPGIDEILNRRRITLIVETSRGVRPETMLIGAYKAEWDHSSISGISHGIDAHIRYLSMSYMSNI